MTYILILCATSDLGIAIAEEYLKEGYGLHLAARSKENLKIQHEKLKKTYPNSDIQTSFFEGELFEEHQQFYTKLNPKPEGVVTVMGYLGEQKVAELSFKESEKIIHANYLNNVSILNIIANDFEKRKYGFIVGVSSVSGERGRKSNYIYGSAKAGFCTYLSGLRNRLYKSNVHVLTINPGFIYTKMTRHLNLPKILTVTPQKVAKDIIRGQKRNKNILYTPLRWKYILLIIKLIPEFIFKRLSL